jgi:hypothetical protein
VPETHRALARPPAQPDLTTGDEGREVHESRPDVAQDDLPLVEPGDVRLHLVHDPPHPEAQPPELRVGVGVVALRRLGDHVAQDDALAVAIGITEADELVALLAQASRDDGQVGDQGVGGVERVEPGHPRIVPTGGHEPLRTQPGVG